MKLLVDRDDLMVKYKNLACELILFEHFVPNVQEIILNAGIATFTEFDFSNCNIIVPTARAVDPTVILQNNRHV